MPHAGRNACRTEGGQAALGVAGGGPVVWGETALLRWLRGGTIAHDRSGRLAAAHTEDATGVLPETGGA